LFALWSWRWTASTEPIMLDVALPRHGQTTPCKRMTHLPRLLRFGKLPCSRKRLGQRDGKGQRRPPLFVVVQRPLVQAAAVHTQQPAVGKLAGQDVAVLRKRTIWVWARVGGERAAGLTSHSQPQAPVLEPSTMQHPATKRPTCAMTARTTAANRSAGEGNQRRQSQRVPAATTSIARGTIEHSMPTSWNTSMAMPSWWLHGRGRGGKKWNVTAAGASGA